MDTQALSAWVPERRLRGGVRASLTVFGNAALAGVADYEQFSGIIQKALFDWGVPVRRLVVGDRLDKWTRHLVDTYALEVGVGVVVVVDDWESFGAAAEAPRDQRLVHSTTHAVGFAAQALPADQRLCRRFFRTAMPVVKIG